MPLQVMRMPLIPLMKKENLFNLFNLNTPSNKPRCNALKRKRF